MKKTGQRSAKEKAGKADRSVLAGVPQSAPALIQAQRLGEKASRVGFDWTSTAAVLKKVEEESQELTAALLTQDLDQQEHELGDLLFALTNLARHLNLDAETALRKAGKRFSTRFRYIEAKLEDNGGIFIALTCAVRNVVGNMKAHRGRRPASARNSFSPPFQAIMR